MLVFTLFIFYSHKVYSEETETILQQLQILQQDIKTLEKAVYSEGVKTTFDNENLSSESNDVLTKHLLKLFSYVHTCLIRNSACARGFSRQDRL